MEQSGWISSIATLGPSEVVHIRGLVEIHRPKMRAQLYPVRWRASETTQRFARIASVTSERFALFLQDPAFRKAGPRLEFGIHMDLAGDLLLVLVRFHSPHEAERRKHDRVPGFHWG